jgi:hypothetical protein
LDPALEGNFSPVNHPLFTFGNRGSDLKNPTTGYFALFRFALSSMRSIVCLADYLETN